MGCLGKQNSCEKKNRQGRILQTINYDPHNRETFVTPLSPPNRSPRVSLAKAEELVTQKVGLGENQPRQVDLHAIDLPAHTPAFQRTRWR